MSLSRFSSVFLSGLVALMLAWTSGPVLSAAAEDVLNEAEEAAGFAREAEARAWEAVEKAESSAARAREYARQATSLDKSEIRSVDYDIGSYQGQVRNGEPNGLGIFYYDTGSRYEGQFVDGLFEGNGVLYFLDNDDSHGDRYEGQFRDDVAEGFGVYYFQSDYTAEGDKYAGQFIDWAFETLGVYYYLESPFWRGTTGAGDFSDGYNQGYGVFEYAGDNAFAGDRYEGQLLDDLHNGYGIYYDNNGEVTYAFWKDDQAVPNRSVVLGDQDASEPESGETTLGGVIFNQGGGTKPSETPDDETPVEEVEDEIEDEMVISSLDPEVTDVPDEVTDEPETVIEEAVPQDGDSSEQVLLAQEMLQNLGYDVGYVDGVMGPQTRNSIIAFQEEVGLPVTGEVDETLIYALTTAVSLTRRIGGLGSDIVSEAPAVNLELWATGTGFVVSSTGDIVTNHHVIEDCEEIRVGDLGQARLNGFDEDNDLALITVSVSEPLEVASFRSQPKVSRGESVVVIGFPLHGTLSSFGNVTDGMISALSGFNDDFREYQFSAPIQPGNSGGPLLDRSGNVIGVVSSELVSGSAEDVPQNVNFAIKAAIVEAFLGAHGVEYLVTPSEESLDVAEIASNAERHTFLVECWGNPEDY